MRYLGISPGPQPSGKGPRSPLVRLCDVVKGGVSLARPLPGLFGDFFGVQDQQAVTVANQVADAFAGSGIRELTTDQRGVASRQVNNLALGLGEDVILALGRAALVEQATEVTGASLTRGFLLEGEICGLQRGLRAAIGLVDGARRVLQTWQYEAQRRMTVQLFLEFIRAQTVEERLQIVMDAAKALDALEKQLAKLRDTRTTNADDHAVLKAQLEEAQNDALMLNTMRDIRDNKTVDEALMQRMGLYYADRVPQGQKPPTPAKAGPRRATKRTQLH